MLSELLWPPCLQRAKTDAFEGLEWDNPERPEARNLLTIYQCVTGKGNSQQQTFLCMWQPEHSSSGPTAAALQPAGLTFLIPLQA